MAAVNDRTGIDGTGIDYYDPSNGAASGVFQPYDPTTSGRLNPDGTLKPPAAASAPANPFTSSSSAQDLINQLNQAGAGPGSAQAAQLTKEYTDALGDTGAALPTPGFSIGQYDPTRNKIYLSGTDLKYDNGQWGNHPWGPDTPAVAPPSSGGGLGQLGDLGSFLRAF
jgi:hypothetical protein